ncbi:MAG TPA: hypothetical protein VGL91_13785 [Acidobacteriota bacterium]
MASHLRVGTAKPQRESLEHCLEVIQEGSIEEKYKILPEISILRSAELIGPLLKILKKGHRQGKEFAALALGALEQTESLDSLYRAVTDPENHRGPGNQSLQTAIIVAMGEIGHDDAIRFLRKAIDYTFKGDVFFKKRKKLILSSAAYVAQQGGLDAVEFIKEYLFCDDPSLRAHALTELSIAYWHRPNHIPDEVLESFFELARDRNSEVRTAAVSSLANLADLGCKKAEDFFTTIAS